MLDQRIFTERFRKESDTAAGIMARALLEDHLKSLLEAALIEGLSEEDKNNLFKATQPLGTFAARIRVAEAMGLINNEEKNDLNRVKAIGNKFAHNVDHPLEFQDDEELRNWVLSMHYPRVLLDNIGFTTERTNPTDIEDIRNRPRRRFEMGVAILWMFLERRISEQRHAVAPNSLLELRWWDFFVHA